MTIEQMQAVVEECSYADYVFTVTESKTTKAIYLQGCYYEPDTLTGVVEHQETRRWLLSPEMSKSEVVSTVFKLCMTSMEHRVREGFLYNAKAIYHPHHDVDQLWEICDTRVVREEVTQ